MTGDVFSPFEKLKPFFPEASEPFSLFTADGAEEILKWIPAGNEQCYSARTRYGTLYLELEWIPRGIRIHSSWERSEGMPRSVVFTLFGINSSRWDQAFFCGEKMGRCLVAEFPLPEGKESNLEGRYYCALTREGSTVLVTTPLAQNYDNIFRAKASGDQLESFRIDFEFLHNDPPRRVEFDPVTLQQGSGVELLEQYGADNAEIKQDFSAPPECGWNSWDYYRWTITEDEVIKNAEFIARDPILKQYVKRIIIDDGWQYCYGEWSPNPNFPSGMKKMAERLHALGFKPGLWLAPTIVEPQSRIAQMDYDMLACSEGGQPCLGYRCMERFGFLMDPTVPRTQQFMADLFDRYAGMGYEYFKLDFLASTLMARRFHDRSVPRNRILRILMDSIYKGIAGRAEILGCNYPFCNGNTKVNAVRVGGDIHARWDSICHNTLSVAGLFWANKRLWINDPDFAVCRSVETTEDPDWQCLKACWVFCRPDDTFKEDHNYVLANAHCHEVLVLLSLVLMTGGAVNLSDNMLRLNEQGLALARKVVSAESGFNTRPVDIFERKLPMYWTQKLSKGGRVLVINWSDEEQEIPVDWSTLAPGIRTVRDFWDGTVQTCPERIKLLPHSCKLWEY